MTLCTRSNSPSRDASRSSASGLKRTRSPRPVRSELGFFRLVRLLCWEEVALTFGDLPRARAWLGVGADPKLGSGSPQRPSTLQHHAPGTLPQADPGLWGTRAGNQVGDSQA